MYPTRGLCTKDKVRYIDEEWSSVPLRPSDCISTAKDKFQHEVTTQDLLVETLIREAQKEKNDSDELYELSEIPQDFFKLVNSDIISSETAFTKGLNMLNPRSSVSSVSENDKFSSEEIE